MCIMVNTLPGQFTLFSFVMLIRLRVAGAIRWQDVMLLKDYLRQHHAAGTLQSAISRAGTFRISAQVIYDDITLRIRIDAFECRRGAIVTILAAACAEALLPAPDICGCRLRLVSLF